MTDARDCFTKKPTLCWDCANCTGGCSWSTEFIPVKGWVATPTHSQYFDSFIVESCPLFDRDAYRGGELRLRDKKLKREKLFVKSNVEI